MSLYDCILLIEYQDSPPSNNNREYYLEKTPVIWYVLDISANFRPIWIKPFSSNKESPKNNFCRYISTIR